MKKFAKVINDITKECWVGIGTDYAFYKDQGFTEQDVTLGYNNIWYLTGYEPDPTEHINNLELQKARQERAEAVSNITIEIDGMIFDGDEISQERMSRTVVAAAATGEPGDATTTWVLHDNTVAQPTISQLARALRAAGEEQTKLWTVPYENKVEDSTENTEAVAA